MAIYAEFDENGPSHQIASTRGWGLFLAWAEKLSGFEKLRKLCIEADTEDIAGVRQELERVLKESPPADPVIAEIVHDLIHAIDAGGPAEIMLITNGVSTGTAAAG